MKNTELVYRTVKNPKIGGAIYVALCVVAGLLVVSQFFKNMHIPAAGFIFMSLVFVANIVNIYFPFFLSSVKYIINETDNTLCVKGDIGSKRTINIGDIFGIDICRNKKEQIKYFRLRTPPSAYSTIQPYYKQEFLEHLLRLNPNMEAREKRAKIL